MTVTDCATTDWKLALKGRGTPPDSNLERVVGDIISQVRTRGDEALLELARKFDAPHVKALEVSEEEIEQASIFPHQAEALELAYQRISAFHKSQVETFARGLKQEATGWSWETKGEKVGQRLRPLRSVGLYVPGGRASYPSSVLMLAGPANAAGVPRLSVTTPCLPNGSLPDSVLVAMKIAGVKKAYKTGGAGAIAALAFGTETIERVDKIAGPGNQYVNEAKRQLWGTVAVDGNYGPSEVCVVIDATSNSAFAAADLLAQLEHAPDNLGFVVSLGRSAFQSLLAEVDVQLANAPRGAILRECVKNVRVFLTDDRSLAAEIVNEIAPEHLSLSVSNPEAMLDGIENAGCVLLGEWTPESVADYCLGPSHTLPTNGAARFASPVNALDFLKVQSVANLTRSQLHPLAELVKEISEAEGFPAHGFAAEVRFDS